MSRRDSLPAEIPAATHATNRSHHLDKRANKLAAAPEPAARKDKIVLLNASKRLKKGKPKNYIPEDATGLSPKAFAAFWALRDSEVLKSGGIDPIELAKEIEKLLARFPNARVNTDEQRQLRAALYRPLLKLEGETRTKIVEQVIEIVTQ